MKFINLNKKILIQNSGQLLKDLNKNQAFTSFIFRNISISSKNFCKDAVPPLDPKKYGGDGRQILHPDFRLRPPPPRTVEDFANPEKTGHWFSLGFDRVDKEADKYWANFNYFFMFTLFFGYVSFWLYYMPDFYTDKDWTNREAYLLIHHREKNDLPLIDKNYVDPSKVILPEENEIDIEIHY